MLAIVFPRKTEHRVLQALRHSPAIFVRISFIFLTKREEQRRYLIVELQENKNTKV